MKNRLWLSVFFTLCAASAASAQTVSFSSGSLANTDRRSSPVRTFTNGGASFCEVSFEFSDGAISQHPINREAYQMIHVQGFSIMGQVGAPALPAHNEIIAMPRNARGKIIILESECQEYPGFNILPCQEPEQDPVTGQGSGFIKNEAIYQTDSYFPENIVEIIHVGVSRGTPLATTQIRPVQFNPVTGFIRVYTKIKFRMVFEGKYLSYDSISRESSVHYTRLLKLSVLNSGNIPDGIPCNNLQSAGTDRSGAKNYIIITHSQYIDQAHRLAEWKRQLGYSTEVVSQDTWTSAQVKSAIQTRYDSWIPKPDFFVIIGDHDGEHAVPAEIRQNPKQEDFATDLYFACLDGPGDWHPDIAHGRISVSSIAEAETVIGKIIGYEKDPPSSPSYYGNLLNCAHYQDDGDEAIGFEDRRFCHTNEEIRNYMQDNYSYQSERVYWTNTQASIASLRYNNGYYSDGHLLPSELRSADFNWQGDASDITAAINSGKFLVIHRDHGFTDGSGWIHPEYTMASMEDLTNGDLLPVVFSLNCYTGEFLRNVCFAEKLLKMENKGAAGVAAAASLSYSGYNDAMAEGMVDAIWADPGLFPDFGNGGTGDNYTIGAGNEIYTLGDVVNQGLFAMEQNWAGTMENHKYTYELFHWFGDPAMKIWTAAPTQITASLPVSVDPEGPAISITGCNAQNALASLTLNDDIIGRITLMNGAGTLTFQCPNPGDTLTLTLSNHNYVPLVSEIIVQPGSGTIVAVNGIDLQLYQWGNISVSVEIFQPDHYFVGIWNHDGSSKPEWAWGADHSPLSAEVGSPVHYLNACESFAFEFDVFPSTVSETFQFWLYREQSPGVFETVKTLTVTMEAPNLNRQDAVLVLERTGSMDGAPLENEKVAASQMISLMEPSDQLAVCSYAAAGSMEFPMTAIENDQVKEDAQTALFDLVADGWDRSVGAGMLAGQGQLSSAVGPVHPQEMILLSNGQETVDPFVNQILPQIPASTAIFSIGLGNEADGALLSMISSITDGAYHFASAPEDLCKVFQGVRQQTSGQQQIMIAEGHITGGWEILHHPVIIDRSTRTATFSLLWHDRDTDLDLKLVSPSGDTIDPELAAQDSLISFNPFPAIESYAILLPDSGCWTALVRRNYSNGSPEDYVISVSGYASIELVDHFRQDNTNVNDTVILHASLMENDAALTGASMAAQIQWIGTLTLYDDGNHRDLMPGDGIYGNWYVNTSEAGNYSITIEASGTSLSSGGYTRSLIRSLYVQPAPEFHSDVTGIDFGQVPLHDTATYDLILSNLASGMTYLRLWDAGTDHPSFFADSTDMILAGGQSDTLHLWFSPSAAGQAAGILTFHTNDPGERQVFIALNGEGIIAPVLVIDLDENHNSGTEMHDILTEMSIKHVYRTNFPSSFDPFDAVFLCLGTFPDNHVLMEEESSALAAFLLQGGNVYVEGGDTWVHDEPTVVHSLFNISGSEDGEGDLDAILGQAFTFTESMAFGYEGDNERIDRLTPVAPASSIFCNEDPAYPCAIANSADGYKTIGTSFEFGGLSEGNQPSGKKELFKRYLEFFCVAVTTHDLIIPSGWSGISSYLEPLSDTLEVLFGHVMGALAVMLEGENVYWPEMNINSIVTWDPFKGYIIKMDEGVTLPFKGFTVTDLILTLEVGWNVIPVLSPFPVSTAELFSAHVNSVVLVKEIAGDRLYWPAWNINTLPFLYPGKAYHVLVASPFPIEFPANQQGRY